MNREINDLEPAVAQLCREFLRRCTAAGLRVVVTETVRSGQRQRALYAQGRLSLDAVNVLRREAGMADIAQADNRIVTKARTSVHEFGCAFDVALMNADQKNAAAGVHWDTQRDDNGNAEADYDEVGRIGEALGLTWGGRFTFSDKCHFEYCGGLSVKELQAGLRPVAVRIKEEVQEMKTEVKKGLFSTEFWLAMIGSVVPVLNGHLGMHIPVEATMTMAGIVISYIVSRTVVKRG